jgi:hypothetical protein
MKLNRSLLAKPNFLKFVLIVGSRHEALGMLADVFILAKEYFIPNKDPIPKVELIEAELPIEKLVKYGFLTKEVEGYYMTDSEAVFTDWKATRELEQRIEAGLKSAVSPKHHAVRGEDGKFIPAAEIAKVNKTKKRNTSGTVRKKSNVDKSGDKSRAPRKKKKGSTSRTRSPKN